MKVIRLFIRVFIVIFCFTMDIKVKADIVVEAVTGHVELEQNDQIFAQNEFLKLPLRLDNSVTSKKDFDVQTFDGSIRFLVDGKEFGVEDSSLFSVEKNETGQFSQGSMFFSLPRGVSFEVQTPQGEIEAKACDFFLEVGEGKTQVSVLSGSVLLVDRASKKSFDISAGYTSWLGGLLVSGQHAHPVRPQAIELNRIMAISKSLMGWTEKEFEIRNNVLTPLWRDAVLKVGEDSQNSVDSDLRVLNQILEREKILEQQKTHEQALLRQLFREKTIGLPGENRVPSSHFQ